MPTLLLAAVCGIIAANIYYYLQPLAVSVAQTVGPPESTAGLFASMTQIGYGMSLIQMPIWMKIAA